MSTHPDERRRRWWVWPVVVGTGAPILAFTIGLDVAHSLMIGLGVAVVVAGSRVIGLGDQAVWPRLPFGRRDGARRDVSSLSWSLYGQQHELTGSGRRRLRRVCLDTLELGDIRLDTPEGVRAAEDLLGRPVTEFLLDEDRPAPDLRGVHRTLTALTKVPLRKAHR
ncbi:hypothetical protein EXU48_04715 [Occultella glacieicola]|uniref:Uncharacterized protein n=1 Tax=Occultella glacieicola TaxID=2518684 RepID=A0ABY2E853_9MICO|nr:hypothetical protein [Occultella glacieicola]TDE97495.1 hypothetical protein EXU48_04715 [Occultella glacieicola]